MKVLQNIKSELVVAIDIETVRITDKYEDLSPDFKSAWEYKNKQDGKVPSLEELSDSWERTASLYAEFSKVCAVSLTSMGKKGLVTKEFYGSNEKALLQALSTSLNGMTALNQQYRLIGHAAKYFDYPFLGKRYIINGLDIPLVLDATNLKPWEQSNLCTNELWKLAGTGAGSSLQALCTALNIPVSKVDLVGDEVGAAYFKGEYARIGRYCSYDSIADYNVLRVFKKESIFSFEDVTYVLGYSDDMPLTEPTVIPVLQRLYMSDKFPEEVKTEIKNTIDRLNGNMTPEDYENLKEIILAHYIDKKDRVADKKAKIEEVEEFINSL